MAEIHIDELIIDPDIQIEGRGVDQETQQAYVAAATNGAKFPPIVVFGENGSKWLADGFHRVSAYRFLGLAMIEADIRPGTRQDAMVYAATANVTNGKPMSQAEKRAAGQRLLEMTNWSDAEISRQLAVSAMSVGRWRASITDVIDGARTVTRNGTTYTIDTSNIGQRSRDDEPEMVSNLWDIQGDSEPEPEVVQWQPQQKPHVSNNSGNNEWYTPPKYIEAARQVMGGIDCDPASSDIANQTVKASTYYTAETDGLYQEWGGRCWMNPPYSQPLIVQFCEALATKYQAGEVTEACILVNNASETGWFDTLAEHAACRCDIKSRVRFIDANGNPSGAPLQGQVVLYFGENSEAFADTFSSFGRIWYAKR